MSACLGVRSCLRQAGVGHRAWSRKSCQLLSEPRALVAGCGGARKSKPQEQRSCPGFRWSSAPEQVEEWRMEEAEQRSRAAAAASRRRASSECGRCRVGITDSRVGTWVNEDGERPDWKMRSPAAWSAGLAGNLEALCRWCSALSWPGELTRVSR